MFGFGRRKKSVWKGCAAGAAGGLAGTVVMSAFQAGWSKIGEFWNQGSGKGHGDQEGGAEPATVQAAEGIAKAVAGKQLSERQKEIGGPLMHYGFGTASGAVFGAVAEHVPAARAGAGTLFGAAVWAGGDEFALPRLGLSKPPSEYPLSTHVQALLAHLVYGYATYRVARAVRAWL